MLYIQADESQSSGTPAYIVALHVTQRNWSSSSLHQPYCAHFKGDNSFGFAAQFVACLKKKKVAFSFITKDFFTIDIGMVEWQVSLTFKTVH